MKTDQKKVRETGCNRGITVNRRELIQLAAGGYAALGINSTARGAPLPATRSDVLVIGAGLSGLNAAMLLEEQGLSVTVLEGRDRIGGRLHTLDDVPGHPEAGGTGVGASYARLIDRARQLGVRLVPGVSESREEQSWHISDQFIPPGKWAAHPSNPQPEEFRHLGPWMFLFSFLNSKLPEIELDGWQSAKYAQLDVPVADYLATHGLNPEAIRLADKFSSYGTNLWQTSLLHFAHIFSFGRVTAQLAQGKPSTTRIEGGSQRMPEAMAGALKGNVLTGRHVVAVHMDHRGVEVRCLDGTLHRSKHVVMSLPFPALRLLHVTPAFTGLQAEAVAALSYHTDFHVYFAIEKPFWERDGLPPSFWSDGPIERFEALKSGPGGSISSFRHYSNGAGTDRFNRMTRDAAAQFVLREVERVRPAAKGALRVLRTASWQHTPFSFGSYASWMPGQIPRFAEAMRKPHHRMFMCGEHTAVLTRGMEGAMESGERAALELLSTA